jgi:hypothetical protein
MAKALIASDGSKPLENNTHERYARFRAAALPRYVAFRKAGNTAKNANVANVSSFRLEKKPEIRERIDYLVRQAQERIIEKRVALEEKLWAIHEANIQDLFEVAVREERPRLISDLAPEVAQLIEDVTVDRKGRLIPRLYSRVQANAELRKMLDIGGKGPEQNDVSRLSDAELIGQLAEQAKALGIEIDLSYSFAQQPSATETDVGRVVDGDSKAVAPGTADCSRASERDAQAAKELTISAQPAIPQRRQGPAEAGARKLNKTARNNKR